jgi:hypothetical protein
MRVSIAVVIASSALLTRCHSRQPAEYMRTYGSSPTAASSAPVLRKKSIRRSRHSVSQSISGLDTQRRRHELQRGAPGSERSCARLFLRPSGNGMERSRPPGDHGWVSRRRPEAADDASRAAAAIHPGSVIHGRRCRRNVRPGGIRNKSREWSLWTLETASCRKRIAAQLNSAEVELFCLVKPSASIGLLRLLDHLDSGRSGRRRPRCQSRDSTG